MGLKYKVHWRRADRCYVVVGEGGREVARVDSIAEAYEVEEALHRADAERIEERKQQAALARASKAARVRSATRHRATA